MKNFVKDYFVTIGGEECRLKLSLRFSAAPASLVLCNHNHKRKYVCVLDEQESLNELANKVQVVRGCLEKPGEKKFKYIDGDDASVTGEKSYKPNFNIALQLGDKFWVVFKEVEYNAEIEVIAEGITQLGKSMNNMDKAVQEKIYEVVLKENKTTESKIMKELDEFKEFISSQLISLNEALKSLSTKVAALETLTSYVKIVDSII